MSAALRWIAVLPGSLLAAVLARAILGPLNMLTMEDSALGLYWGGFFNGAVWVFAMTVAGSWIAPARKIETGAILGREWTSRAPEGERCPGDHRSAIRLRGPQRSRHMG